MGYKVTRRELIKRRPEWMISFLMMLNPNCYKVQPTREAASKILVCIRKTIKESRVCEKTFHMHILEREGELSIVNSKGKPVLSCSVTEA